MNQSWPPDSDMKSCTCTPLANDPDCYVHAVVPFGEKPLTWAQARQTTRYKILSKAVSAAVVLIVLMVLIRVVLSVKEVLF